MASTKSFINIVNKYDRVVVLVDMDCFYCQVEEKLDPSLKGKPIAVVQYNAWKGGGIIAVNYPARAQGVTRHMRGDEAKEQCPEIVLVKVPSIREKADLTKYRDAGKEVAAVLQKFTPLLERASVDEAYMDITEEVVKRLATMNNGSFQLKPTELTNTYAVGYDNFGQYVQEISSRIDHDIDDYDCADDDIPAVRKSDMKLLLGASIVNEIRAKVKEKTGYDCSAGIAHNKILAKLACGINKPDKQTILPLRQIGPLFSTLPIGKIKGLGGKFGEELCERMNVKFLGDLLSFTENELQRKFDEKNGSWLYLIARGIDLELVTPRFTSKSIGCCKKFPGITAISELSTLNHWFNELAKEISERMEKDVMENNRKAKQMVTSYIQEINGEEVSSSRSTPLTSYEPESMANNAFEVLRKNTDQLFKTGSNATLNNPIKFLGISVSKFETIETNKNTIQKLFMNHAKKKEQPATEEENPPLGDKKEKSIQRSFFANHIKKSTSVPVNNDFEQSSSDEKTSNDDTTKPKAIKSFFLNATKRKIIEETQLNETPALCEDPVEMRPELDARDQPGTSYETSDCNFDTNPNYTNTYAEFLIPQAKDDDYIKCDKCDKKILSYAIEEHKDFHFALEISQEQRNQFRSEIKIQKHSSPPMKKLKTTPGRVGTQSSKVKSEISIQKFLKKEPEILENIISFDTEEKQMCPECSIIIPVTKMQEHQDYHTARKLQLQLNRPTSQLPPTNSVKKIIAKGATKVQSGKTKSITNFFTSQT